MLDLNGARGRSRTTDTRIFKPKLLYGNQTFIGDFRVKPMTENQALIPILSNLNRGPTDAGKFVGGSYVCDLALLQNQAPVSAGNGHGS